MLSQIVNILAMVVMFSSNAISSSITEQINTSIKHNLSELEGNNISIVAGNDINIVGGEIEATNDLNISAEDEVMVSGVVDSEYNYYFSHESEMDFAAMTAAAAGGMMTGGIGALAALDYAKDLKKGSIDASMSYDESVVSSQLTANNIYIESAGDMTLLSANLDATNQLGLYAGYMRDEFGTLQEVNGESKLLIGNLIENDQSYSYHEDYGTNPLAAAVGGIAVGTATNVGAAIGMTIGTIVAPFNPALGAGIVATGAEMGKDYGEEFAGSILEDKHIKEVRTDQKTVVSSDLSSYEMLGYSADDLTIMASNITTTGDLNLISTNGDVNVISALSTTEIYEYERDQGFSGVDTGYDRGRIYAGINFDGDETTTKTTTSEVVGSNITSGGNTIINASEDVNIVGSNVISNDNLLLNSENGDVNIMSAVNTVKIEEIIKDIDMLLSVGVSHTALEAAYVVDDMVRAGEEVKSAYDNLEEMKELEKVGKASDRAVRDAEVNLTLAILNFEVAVKMAANAVGEAGKSAPLLGFKGDVKLDMAVMESESNLYEVTNTASHVLAYNDISISADNDINQKGSHTMSETGDITYLAGNDINIEASLDSMNYDYGSESYNASIGVVGTTGKDLSGMLNMGYSESDQEIRSDNYNNSSITAENGEISLTSQNDTTISGANILGEDIAMNIGGDLLVESKQNEYYMEGSNEGYNGGVGFNKQSGQSTAGNGSMGYNVGSEELDRKWVDNETSIIGTNSVDIAVNDTLTLTGAAIANATYDAQGNLVDGGNLQITANELIYSDLNNSEDYYSSQYGVNIGYGIGDQTNPANSNRETVAGLDPNNTKVTVKTDGYEMEGVTRATIGDGEIVINGDVIANDSEAISDLNRDVNNISEITKDQITAGLDGEISIATAQMLLSNIEYLYNLTTDTEATLDISQDAVGKFINDMLLATGNLLSALGAHSSGSAGANPTQTSNTAPTSPETGNILLDSLLFVADVTGKVWTVPNTAIGLLYGITSYLVGIPLEGGVKVDFGNNAIQFTGSKLGDSEGGAITIGNVIIYFGTWDENTSSDRYDNLGIKINVGVHEEAHTYQYQVFGPLFLPFYLMLKPFSEHSPFENAADDHAEGKDGWFPHGKQK